MALNVDIGKRIKQYRQKHSLTLKDIESRVDVSATHISEIERGKTTPTVGALSKIADALNVDPAMFLVNDEVPHVGVVRAKERGTVHFNPGNFQVEPLSVAVPSQDLSAAICHWPPNMTDAPVRQHAGEEFGYVLRGRLQITVGESVYNLSEGDTIHFRSTAPHRILNRDDETCVAIWVTRPKYGF